MIWRAGRSSLGRCTRTPAAPAAVTAISIEGDAKVTVYKHVNYDGWSKVYTSSVANVGKDRNDEISSMVIESQSRTKTVTENLQKYLNDAPIQGKILASGIKPAKKTVVKTSVKK